jgi:DNA-binding SARP family transcriptional activator
LVTAAQGPPQGRRIRSTLVPSARLRLLSEFQLLIDGSAIRLPHSVERVIAFLGVQRAPVNRARLAASLWPDVADQRANGDLRSALWRLRRITGVIEERDNRLALGPGVAVDVADMAALTQELIGEPQQPSLARLADLVQGEDLLPGWDEDWLIVERERYRMLRLRALERSAEVLLDADELGPALDAALASVATEPYRESAHRLVVKVHLAEGNYADAVGTYRAFRRLLADELGIAPSPRMEELIAPLHSDDNSLTVA